MRSPAVQEGRGIGNFKQVSGCSTKVHWRVLGGADARVMEGDGLADAQADDALLAGQQLDVDQVGAAHRRPHRTHHTLQKVDEQRRRDPDLRSGTWNSRRLSEKSVADQH